MIAEILISIMLLISGLFALVGSFGLLKLDDPMKRLHAPTKATTVGVGATLIASMLFSLAFLDVVSWQELLIVIFLLISAPITAHFLSKAHMHRKMRPEELPPSGTGRAWATFESDDEDAPGRP